MKDAPVMMANISNQYIRPQVFLGVVGDWPSHWTWVANSCPSSSPLFVMSHLIKLNILCGASLLALCVVFCCANTQTRNFRMAFREIRWTCFELLVPFVKSAKFVWSCISSWKCAYTSALSFNRLSRDALRLLGFPQRTQDKWFEPYASARRSCAEIFNYVCES